MLEDDQSSSSDDQVRALRKARSDDLNLIAEDTSSDPQSSAGTNQLSSGSNGEDEDTNQADRINSPAIVCDHDGESVASGGAANSEDGSHDSSNTEGHVRNSPPEQELFEDEEALLTLDEVIARGAGDILRDDDSSEDEEIYEDAEEEIFEDAEEEIFEGEENFEDEIPYRRRDPPIYMGASITITESLVAILTFAIVHNLTGVALSDLLALVAMHCLETNVHLKSLYRFKKYFRDIEAPLKLHYFCSHCFSPLASQNDRCQKEDCVQNEAGVSYFVQIPILHQLKNMFSREGFFDSLNFRFRRTRQNPDNYEDIYDGSVYQSKVANNGYLSDVRNISFLWNTDGVSIFKSAKFSIWPFFLVINELSYAMRFKKENVVLAGLWFGPQKPKIPLFLRSFHEDLSALYQGTNFNVLGNNIKVKARVLCGTCDMPAKSLMLFVTQYNGYYGCPNCKIRGERSERTNNNHAYPFGHHRLRTQEETNRYARLAEQHENASIFGIKGFSPLRLYVKDYITTTAIDVMHCVYEGCVKKMMMFWFDPDFRNCEFSKFEDGEMVSKLLHHITPPSYINRMPRSVTDHLKLWKAAEFKNWLYYYSVAILSLILSPELFNHYLLLFMAFTC